MLEFFRIQFGNHNFHLISFTDEDTRAGHSSGQSSMSWGLKLALAILWYILQNHNCFLKLPHVWVVFRMIYFTRLNKIPHESLGSQWQVFPAEAFGTKAE